MSEQSDSSSHTLRRRDRQSCLLFACLSGEHRRPAQALLPLQAEFSSPSKIRSYQLTITTQTATAAQQLKQLARNGEQPQGQTGQVDAGMLYSLGEEPGPTSPAHQAGKSSPASDTDSCNLQSSRMYTCEQQEEKNHKTSQFRIQGHCRATGERNLAASGKVSAEQ